MKTMVGLLTTLLLPALLHAQDASQFRPPQSFNGHRWGEPLAALSGAQFLEAGTATDSIGVSNPQPVTGNGPVSEDPNLKGQQGVYSPGFNTYAPAPNTNTLAEYYLDSEPHPWPGKGIEIYTLSYLFCADGFGWQVPAHIKDHLSLCGARVVFHSDASVEPAKRGAARATNYERILQQLVSEYGEPSGYTRHGRVIVQSGADESVGKSAVGADMSVYHWCGAVVSAVQPRPNCSATVTIAFNAKRGVGTVIYATGPVYDFAHLRHAGGDEHNELYLLLYEGDIRMLARFEEHRCTGSHLCRPRTEPLSARQLQAFQP